MLTAQDRALLRWQIDRAKRRRLAAAGEAEPGYVRWTAHAPVNRQLDLVSVTRQDRGGTAALSVTDVPRPA